jgi:hypothetical protein
MTAAESVTISNAQTRRAGVEPQHKRAGGDRGRRDHCDAPWTRSEQGGRDRDFSGGQQREERPSGRPFSQVLRDDGGMQVRTCNQTGHHK